MNQLMPAMIGVLAFLLSRVTYDYIQRQIRRRGLVQLLVAESVATATRFRQLLPTIQVHSNSDPIGIADVRRLSSSFHLSKPDEIFRELLGLTRELYLRRHLLNWFDRWDRWTLFEATYSDLHKRLLYETAKKESCPELVAELWAQIEGTAIDLRKIALELSILARRFVRKLGPAQDHDLQTVSTDAWTDYSALEEEWTALEDELSITDQ